MKVKYLFNIFKKALLRIIIFAIFVRRNIFQWRSFLEIAGIRAMGLSKRK